MNTMNAAELDGGERQVEGTLENRPPWLQTP